MNVYITIVLALAVMGSLGRAMLQAAKDKPAEAAGEIFGAIIKIVALAFSICNLVK